MDDKLNTFFGYVFSIGLLALIGWMVVSAFNSDRTDYSSDNSLYEGSSVSSSQGYLEDNYYEEELPSGTYTVEACSGNSGNCYDLDADISDGVVDTIYFSNGGYLDIWAELDEGGYGYGSSDNGDSWDIYCYDC